MLRRALIRHCRLKNRSLRRAPVIIPPALLHIERHHARSASVPSHQLHLARGPPRVAPLLQLRSTPASSARPPDLISPGALVAFAHEHRLDQTRETVHALI